MAMKTFVISRDSWYYRLYDFYHRAMAQWTRNSYGEPSYAFRQTPEKVDLCSLMRCILVWLPILTALHILAYGSIFVGAVGLPIYVFGAGNFLAAIGIIIAVIVGVVITIFGGGWVLGKTFTYASGFVMDWFPWFGRSKFWVDYREDRREICEQRHEKIASFFDCISMWLQGRKEKVCFYMETAEGAAEREAREAKDAEREKAEAELEELVEEIIEENKAAAESESPKKEEKKDE